MLRSEIEASNAVDRLGIKHPDLRNLLYKHYLHFFKLHYGEYPRLPRKLKKRLQKEENRKATVTAFACTSQGQAQRFGRFHKPLNQEIKSK